MDGLTLIMGQIDSGVVLNNDNDDNDDNNNIKWNNKKSFGSISKAQCVEINNMALKLLAS